jgi:hypothetical protein
MLVSAGALAHLPGPNPAAATGPKCSWGVMLARADEVAECAQRPLASLPPGARASRELRLVDACSGAQSRQEIVTQRAEDGDPRTRALRVGVVEINRNHIMMRRILSGMIEVLMRQGEVTALSSGACTDAALLRLTDGEFTLGKRTPAGSH